jgi:hypothetical protein
MPTLTETTVLKPGCSAAGAADPPPVGPVVDRRSVLCLAGLGLVPSLLACGPQQTALPTVAAPRWHNASSTLVIQPEQLVYPGDAASLVALVQAAAKRGKRVRMTGSGHS